MNGWWLLVEGLNVDWIYEYEATRPWRDGRGKGQIEGVSISREQSASSWNKRGNGCCHICFDVALTASYVHIVCLCNRLLNPIMLHVSVINLDDPLDLESFPRQLLSFIHLQHFMMNICVPQRTSSATRLGKCPPQ